MIIIKDEWSSRIDISDCNIIDSHKNNDNGNRNDDDDDDDDEDDDNYNNDNMHRE